MIYFLATFKDGTEYKQNDQDTSTIEDGKNAFYDVLQRSEELETFSLIDESDKYTVNLSDGSFTVNGATFGSHDQFYNPLGRLSLVYHKEMHQNFNVGEVEPYEIKCNRYFIGWEDENSNKCTINIKGKTNG